MANPILTTFARDAATARNPDALRACRVRAYKSLITHHSMPAVSRHVLAIAAALNAAQDIARQEA